MAFWLSPRLKGIPDYSYDHAAQAVSARTISYFAWRLRLSLVSILDLSNDSGLCAICLLTLNILLGLLLSVKYNPVRRWPHRRINTVRLHNWTGYTALAVSFL